MYSLRQPVLSTGGLVFIKSILHKAFSNIFFRNDRVAFFVLMILATSVILTRGSSRDQGGLMGNLINSYVEETAASVITISSQNQLADINSLATLTNNKNISASISEINTIQDNSIVSRGTILTNIFEEFVDRGSQVSTYTVQEGDTLSFIASDYGVSINTIIWANNLSSPDSINPGMDLKIPPVSGVLHKTKKGDTVSSLAKKYGIKEEEIISFNSLPLAGDLQIDQEIVIPGGTIQTPKAPSSTSVNRFAYLPNLGGYFMQPTTGYNWGRIHGRNGVDIANSCGTSIYAAASGTVVLAMPSGYNGGFGKFIKIVHPNGTETLYAHASNLLVVQGEAVGQGQKIALMGTTGRSTGCHLHFEVHGAKNPLIK
ncbi:MAG TPA: peptidoglycan DD-metalloendopeptidase family protein [Candidatus Paceibacterota bacterium]